MENAHSGHRQRMRDRFKKSGSFDSFAEHEILEMFLFHIYTRKNTNEIAHSLIERFGSIKGVLAAPRDELLQIDSVGERAVDELYFFCQLFNHLEREKIGEVDVNNFEDMSKYVSTYFVGQNTEILKIFCVNSTGSIQSVESMSIGSSSNLIFDYKTILKPILNSGCNAIALAHNHPNSSSAPSSEDIHTTQDLISYLKHLNIDVLDHFIVGTDGVTSMRKYGYIKY